MVEIRIIPRTNKLIPVRINVCERPIVRKQAKIANKKDN